jgi:hypothetical protein
LTGWAAADLSVQVNFKSRFGETAIFPDSFGDRADHFDLAGGQIDPDFACAISSVEDCFLWPALFGLLVDKRKSCL